MNGFDEDTWQKLLQDPRVAGEAAYLGPDADQPPWWQVDQQAVEQFDQELVVDTYGELYYSEVITSSPVVQGNLPLDAFGMPTLT